MVESCRYPPGKISCTSVILVALVLLRNKVKGGEMNDCLRDWVRFCGCECPALMGAEGGGAVERVEREEEERKPLLLPVRATMSRRPAAAAATTVGAAKPTAAGKGWELV